MLSGVRIGPLLVLMMLLLPAQATAGGWWTSPRLDRSTVAPGQRVKVSSYALFTADTPPAPPGPAFIYLLRGLDRSVVQRAMRTANNGDWWSPGDAEATSVGRFPSEGGRASFILPNVQPGAYDLMLCDTGCRHTLGDAIPVRLTVVADPVVARHAQRLDRIDARLNRDASLLSASRAANREAWAQIEQLRNIQQPPERDTVTPMHAYAGWLVAGFALGALGFVVVRRTRHSAFVAAFQRTSDDGISGGRGPARRSRPELVDRRRR